MDVRVLEYFLALVRAGSISAAARDLHVSQPTLSRQLAALEDELGCPLFERGRRGVRLTREGMLLRRRAGEIVGLMSATRSELLAARGTVEGEVSVGCAETRAVRSLARVMGSVRADYPRVTFRIESGTAEDVAEKIARGLLDFGLLLRRTEVEGLSYLQLDTTERWGVLVRKDSPLARRERLGCTDLAGEPVIVPSTHRQSGLPERLLAGEGGRAPVQVASYNLVYNATCLAEEGLGAVITLEGLFLETPESPLTFRPLDVACDMPAYLVWKPFSLRSRACEVFLDRARAELPRRVEVSGDAGTLCSGPVPDADDFCKEDE